MVGMYCDLIVDNVWNVPWLQCSLALLYLVAVEHIIRGRVTLLGCAVIHWTCKSLFFMLTLSGMYNDFIVISHACTSWQSSASDAGGCRSNYVQWCTERASHWLSCWHSSECTVILLLFHMPVLMAVERVRRGRVPLPLCTVMYWTCKSMFSNVDNVWNVP